MAAKKAAKKKKPKVVGGVKKKGKGEKKGKAGKKELPPKEDQGDNENKKKGRRKKKGRSKGPKKPLTKRELELKKKQKEKDLQERQRLEAIETEKRNQILAEEDIKRGLQLRDSAGIISQYEKIIYAHIQKLKKLLEWEFFIACKDTPDVSDLISVNSYMTEWILDLQEPTLDALFHHVPGVLEVIEHLKAFLEIPPENIKMETIYELGLMFQEFQEKLQDYLDQGTYNFVEDLTEYYDPEIGIFETIVKNPEETISHGIWGNLFGTPDQTEHEYSGSGFKFQIPETISRNESVFRLLKTNYDHFSHKCYSYYAPGIDNPLRQSIENWQKKKTEHLVKLAELESPEDKKKKRRRRKKKDKKKRKGKRRKKKKGGSKKGRSKKKKGKGKKSGGDTTTSGEEGTSDTLDDDSEWDDDDTDYDDLDDEEKSKKNLEASSKKGKKKKKGKGKGKKKKKLASSTEGETTDGEEEGETGEEGEGKPKKKKKGKKKKKKAKSKKKRSKRKGTTDEDYFTTTDYYGAETEGEFETEEEWEDQTENFEDDDDDQFDDNERHGSIPDGDKDLEYFGEGEAEDEDEEEEEHHKHKQKRHSRRDSATKKENGEETEKDVTKKKKVKKHIKVDSETQQAETTEGEEMTTEATDKPKKKKAKKKKRKGRSKKKKKRKKKKKSRSKSKGKKKKGKRSKSEKTSSESESESESRSRSRSRGKGKKKKGGKSKSKSRSTSRETRSKTPKKGGKKAGRSKTKSKSPGKRSKSSKRSTSSKSRKGRSKTPKKKKGGKGKKDKSRSKSKKRSKSKGKGKKGRSKSKKRKGKRKGRSKGKKGKKGKKKGKKRSKDKNAAAKAKERERLEKAPFIAPTKPNELNLRNFSVVGGVYNFNMLHVPPQPKNRGVWTIHLMEEERIMKEIPFFEEYSDPPLPNAEEEWLKSPEGQEMAAKDAEYQKLVELDVKLPEIILAEREETIQGNVERLKKFEQGLMEMYEDQKEQLLNKLITITVQLPEDVIWFGVPKPVRWDEDEHIWSTDGFYNIKYDEETATLKFRTSCFGILGFGADRWINMPYTFWELRPLEQSRTRLTLKAQHVTLEFTIQNDEICLSSLQDVPRSQKVQDNLLNVYMKPAAFIKAIRACGIDVFPDFDSYAYMDGILIKQTDIEEHIYQCMAIVSSGFNISWSKWNNLVDRDKMVYRMQHRSGRGDLTVLNTFRFATFVNCNEDSKKMSEEPLPGLQYTADLLQLITLNGGTEIRDQLRATSPPHVETVRLLLSLVRPLSFS